MSVPVEQRWLDGNQAFLASELARIKRALVRSTAKRPRSANVAAEEKADEAARTAELQRALKQMSSPPALHNLCLSCSLTNFERDVLLLCAGVELDASLAAACREAGGRAQPTAALAMDALAEAHLSALSPMGTLRRARLIELTNESGATLAQCPLRIAERVLHYLTGIMTADDQLRPLLHHVSPPESGAMTASHAAVARRVQTALTADRPAHSEPPAIWLCGADARDRRDIAARACADLHLDLYVLRAAELPRNAVERQQLLVLWERELYLSDSALLVHCEDAEPAESVRAAMSWLERMPGVVLLTSDDAFPLGETNGRRWVRIDVPRPTWTERTALWQKIIAQAAPRDVAAAMKPETFERLAANFRLGAGAIRDAGLDAAGRVQAGLSWDAAVWESCRQHARPQLDDLARRIEPQASWDMLVLPDAQRQTLREMVAQQRQQPTVYHRWGMGGAEARGLGLTALFFGQSGTGKTLATEVLAGELKLDLFHIDLSQIVSKYIGETEKNLRRVFDAAEEGGAVLLFDEADALFGKRSEVKDSHDRYANIEVSYLLQRMEAYQGISVLTSNQKSALDSAFLRRIRFIVPFPFPDKPQRAEMWRRAFPQSVPTEGLDIEKLARLHITGGQIRNISLAAAFLAADEGRPVQMRHLLAATRTEYQKNERPLTEAEIGGWV